MRVRQASISVARGRRSWMASRSSWGRGWKATRACVRRGCTERSRSAASKADTRRNTAEETESRLRHQLRATIIRRSVFTAIKLHAEHLHAAAHVIRDVHEALIVHGDPGGLPELAGPRPVRPPLPQQLALRRKDPHHVRSRHVEASLTVQRDPSPARAALLQTSQEPALQRDDHERTRGVVRHDVERAARVVDGKAPGVELRGGPFPDEGAAAAGEEQDAVLAPIGARRRRRTRPPPRRGDS